MRATSDAVSLRSTWRGVRPKLSGHGSDQAIQKFDRTIGAIDDAIGTRNGKRVSIALAAADADLASLETALDNQEPPWRRFIREHFGV